MEFLLLEKIIPASDLSEQISTAGKEASGTGNMKFALNGALTIGTLDGANVEIREEVGEENIFIFGKTVEEIQNLQKGNYEPFSIYEQDEELKAVIDWLDSDYFSPDEGRVLSDLSKSLLSWGDPYYVLSDYRSYIEAQRELIKLTATRKFGRDGDKQYSRFRKVFFRPNNFRICRRNLKLSKVSVE